jgi:hypothetical protein
MRQTADVWADLAVVESSTSAVPERLLFLRADSYVEMLRKRLECRETRTYKNNTDSTRQMTIFRRGRLVARYAPTSRETGVTSRLDGWVSKKVGFINILLGRKRSNKIAGKETADE